MGDVRVLQLDVEDAVDVAAEACVRFFADEADEHYDRY